jgi:hypothetical protein
MTEFLLKSLYNTYRHAPSPSAKGAFFSPTCMQTCRTNPTYAATSREEIVKYLEDAENGKIPNKNNEMYGKVPNRNDPEPANNGLHDKVPNRNDPVPDNELYGKVPSRGDLTSTPSAPLKPKGKYTIRALHPTEFEFGTADITKYINFSPEELERKARDEGWVGMRVDLWDEEEGGMLVKVKYWWREEEGEDKEGKAWMQCLHDIMHLGPRDGTEGERGLEILE